MSCNLTLYVANSNVVELTDLTNTDTDEFDTGATVTITLYDRDGAEVAGNVWPAGMDYVTGTDATYRTTLDSDIVIVAGKKYLAVIDAEGSSGQIGHWEADVVAETRKCD